MAHWKLTPAQLKELGEDEISVMNFSHHLYERRWYELLGDLFGLLLGTSWPVTSEIDKKTSEVELPHEKHYRWSLRDKPDRINTPLSFVIGGENFIKNIKKLVAERKVSKRTDPSILNHPGKDWAGGREEIIDLSTVSKEQFLKVASRVR